jgi:hypothetical protein
MASQRIELRAPEFAVGRNPLRRVLHGSRLQPAQHGAPALRAAQQPGGFQHREVLHHARQRDRERLREFGDGALAPGEPREQRAPRAVGKRREGAVERLLRILNHTVKYRLPPVRLSSPFAPRIGLPLDWNPIQTAMDTLSTFALIAGLGWASGVRLYAVLFFLGLLHYTGALALPPGLELLAHPVVMAVSGLLFVTEFFADKVPGFDTLWDAVHTFIRIPGAALLAAAAVAHGDHGLALAAGLLGGAFAAGAHLTKAGARVLINASPEPFSNWVASFGEDALALVALWSAFKYPALLLAALLLFVVAALLLMPRLVRGLRTVFAAIRRLLGVPA